MFSVVRNKNCQGLDPESLMFRDGRRKIDMVICYEEENEGVMTEIEARKRELRKVFLENLVKDGLELEIEDKVQSFDEKTCFVKIHLPWRSEARFAEVLNLRLPVKRFITISVKAWVGQVGIRAMQNRTPRKHSIEPLIYSRMTTRTRC